MINYGRTLFILLLFPLFTSFIYEINKEPKLIEFISSECQEGVYFRNLHKIQNRILDIKTENNSHFYEIFVVANCGEASLGKIELKNDTLNLKYGGTPYLRKATEVLNEETGIIEITEEYVIDHTSCDCAFVLNYRIEGLENKDYIVMANGKLITKNNHKYKVRRKIPTFDVIDNDTINVVDIYGLKQGLHVSYREDGKLLFKMKYEDDEKISGMSIVRYNFDGFDKVETHMKNKLYTKKKYYNKGELIKECDTDGTFDEGTNCVYFD